MQWDATGADGLRVRCPADGCKYEVLESSWTHLPISDHCCPENHWFRIEGCDPDNLDSFHFYQIDPHEIQFEHVL